MNKVILIGFVGKDPESRTLENGAVVVNLTIATSKSWKDKEGVKQSKTEWHNLVAWRGLAEVISKYIKKGDKIAIQGELQTRKWDDKDGNTRYTTEIVLTDMEMLGSKKEASTGPEKATEAEKPAAATNTEKDEHPF